VKWKLPRLPVRIVRASPRELVSVTSAFANLKSHGVMTLPETVTLAAVGANGSLMKKIAAPWSVAVGTNESTPASGVEAEASEFGTPTTILSPLMATLKPKLSNAAPPGAVSFCFCVHVVPLLTKNYLSAARNKTC